MKEQLSPVRVGLAIMIVFLLAWVVGRAAICEEPFMRFPARVAIGMLVIFIVLVWRHIRKENKP